MRDFLTALFYYRRIMACAFIACVLLGLAAASVTRPVYVAQARLLVLYGGEYFYQPAGGQAGDAVALDRNEIMTSELEVLKNTELAKQTLLTVGLDRVYPGTKPDDSQALDAAAHRMESDLSLTSIAQSNILDLSFRNHDPQVAVEVLRTLIAGYLADRVKVFQRVPTAVVLAEQDAMLNRLRGAEAALSDFAAAHGIVDLDTQATLLLQRQSANRQARDETAQAIGESEAKLAAIQAQLKDIPPIIQSYAESDRSQTKQALTDSLLRLQIKRRDLAQHYGDSHPDIQSLDQQIQWVQAQLAAAPSRVDASTRDGPNPLYQDLRQQAAALQAQIQGLHARQTQLADAAAGIETRIHDLTVTESAYRDLKRNRDVLDETYRALVKTNEASQATSNAEVSRTANVRVVQPPVASGARLNMRLILAIGGAAVGVAAALAAMALCNAMRQVFITPRDVSLALELPVLAAVAKKRVRRPRGRPAPPVHGMQGA
jgi:uncharacterized protein involved in exopolysaccharide biosynthesis